MNMLNSRQGAMTRPAEYPLSNNIENVIAERRITTVFHPIVSMTDQSIIGVEALSRGIDAQSGGFIPPDVLFGQAHECGCVNELDQLCREIAMFNFQRLFRDDERLMLWLNFEPCTLDEDGDDCRLLDLALELDIDPERIVIEIIETKAANTDALRDFVREYRNQGFLFAIDDMGSEYSNMERIDLLKPDIIKIHRSLASDLGAAYHQQELVRSILTLAHGIGALVVVEGVETSTSALTAMELGASIMQGFYFCRPDTDRVKMENLCQRGIDRLAEEYKTRKVKMFNARRDYFSKIDMIVGRLKSLIQELEFSEYERLFDKIIKEHPELECIYLLDENGVQVSRTICAGGKLKRDSVLFQPPRKGADRSLGDFFLLIQSGLTRYVSEPYISRSSGNRCVTISQVFENPEGRRLVLCADCNCRLDSIRAVHPHRRVFNI